MRARKLRCCAVLAAAQAALGIGSLTQGRLWADHDAPKVIKAHAVARGRELLYSYLVSHRSNHSKLKGKN